MYKSLFEEGIFENVLLVVVKMKSGTMKVVNTKFSLHITIFHVDTITFTFTFIEEYKTFIILGLTNLDLGFRVKGCARFLECEI